MAGDAVSISLRPPAAAGAIVKTGRIVWCLTLAGGSFRAGLQFDEPLSDAEMTRLVLCRP